MSDIAALLEKFGLPADTLASREAVRLLGLRDYASLLVALGDTKLPMPMPPADEIDKQAATFVKIWNTT